MSLSSDKDGDVRRKSDPPRDPQVRDPKTKSESRPAKARGDDGVGKTLRTVYQRAVDEAIPPEMLDLLGKLN